MSISYQDALDQLVDGGQV